MENPALNYRDLVEEIVLKTRKRGLITSISETATNSGRYILELSDYDGVEVGKYVDLGVDGLDSAKILSIPQDGKMIVSGKVGADVSNVVKYIRLDPFFYGDRRLKTIEALLSKNNSYFKDKKFPSVELVLDVNNFKDSFTGVSSWNSMKVIFCETSNPNDTAETKDDNIFKKVLRPNYLSFIAELKKTKGANTENATLNRTEFYGEIYKTGEGYDKGFFVDALVLQISGLDLDLSIDYCNNKDF